MSSSSLKSLKDLSVDKCPVTQTWAAYIGVYDTCITGKPARRGWIGDQGASWWSWKKASLDIDVCTAS
jgi:hypothetical protein